MKKVTILDVAAEAGVSRQTVTRAMNDMGDISASTRARVLEVSERLGYRPSRFARSLVTRTKSHALGFVVASFTNPYYTDIAGDLVDTAQARGWQLIMGSFEADRAAVLELMSTQVDVIVGHFGEDDEQLLLESRGTPIVKLESPASARGVHSVEIDIAAGVRRAVRELSARGARRFGMIDSAYTTRHGHDYEPSPRRGFVEDFAGKRMSGVVVGEETISGGAAAFQQLMAQHPDTDAVIVFNDLMALGAVQAATSAGIAVPDQVRIMGIDGLNLGEAVSPPLTSIALDRRALASSAMDIVEGLAAGHFAISDSIKVVLKPRILWRASA